jgi:hypothetical protein
LADTEVADPARDPVKAASFGKKAFWIAGSGAILLVMLTVAFLVILDSSPQPRPLPVPNGYDDLMVAARMIGGVIPQELSSPDVPRAELQAFVEVNQESLQWARDGLGKPCGVWLTFGQDKQNMQHFFDRIGALRNLGRLFYAEGKLAELDGETATAAESYADVIRLSHECRRGGLLLDCMTGAAIESMGIEGLGGLRDQLNETQCRELIEQLDELERNREPYDTFLTNEAIWRKQSIPLYHRFILGISGTGRDLLQVSIDHGNFAYKKSQARSQLLLLSLAAQAYFEDRGGYPEHLTELAPDYLPHQPQDPFSDRPFLYRRTRAGVIVYSIGPQQSAGRHGRGTSQTDVGVKSTVVRRS